MRVSFGRWEEVVRCELIDMFRVFCGICIVDRSIAGQLFMGIASAL